MNNIPDDIVKEIITTDTFSVKTHKNGTIVILDKKTNISYFIPNDHSIFNKTTLGIKKKG